MRKLRNNPGWNGPLSILGQLLLWLVLLTGNALVSRAQPSNSPPPKTLTPNLSSLRDVFYFSDRFGFRFVSPSGYVIEPTPPPQATQPNAPLEILEIWEQGEFMSRETLTEAPPTIRVSIYSNPQRLPLTRWKGELSRQDDRSLSIAGQAAIAYSSTGLYETDNVLFSSPDQRYVVRLQVGYLKPDDEIRQTFQSLLTSFSFDLLPKTLPSHPSRINYTRLQTLLNQRHWLAGDVETRAIVQRLQRLNGKSGDFLFEIPSVINRLPCNDLRTIDTEWSKASQGRFGYRAQSRQWQQTRSFSNPRKPEIRTEQWGKRVGWRRSTPLPEDNPLGLEVSGTQWRLDVELTSTLPAPIGQFPWGGVSSSLLGDFLAERSLGCGSCTVDAMNLSNDRYYKYIPAFMNRLNQCQLK